MKKFDCKCNQKSGYKKPDCISIKDISSVAIFYNPYHKEKAVKRFLEIPFNYCPECGKKLIDIE